MSTMWPRFLEPAWTDPVERLAARVWVAWPRAVMLRWPSLRGIVGDGHSLVVNPPGAVLAPVVVLLLSFATGALQLGYDTVVTESVALMAIAVALGAFSGQLSLLALVGFATGEFFVGVRVWSLVSPVGDGLFSEGVLGALARVRLPLVISYLLLAAIMLVLPRAARNLLAAVGRWRAIPAVLAWPLASGLYLLVMWQATRAWAAAAPILVRPRFTFLGRDPTAATIQPLQVGWRTLVAWAIVAAIVRQLLLLAAMTRGPLAERVQRAEQAPPAGRMPDEPRVAAPGGSLTADIGAAVAATLVLTGLFQHVVIAVVTFAVLLAARLLRSGRLEVGWLDTWRLVLHRVPVALRLAGLWLLVILIAGNVANDTIGSYTAMVVVILAGVALSLLLFPGPPPPELLDAGEPGDGDVDDSDASGNGDAS